MQVEELLKLTKWIDTEIKEKQLVSKYQQVQTVLDNNAQPNTQKNSFENQQNNLIIALNDISFLNLTKDQIEFLGALGIAPLVGSDGAHNVENILFRNSIDIATASSKFQQIIQQLNEAMRKSDQIAEGLRDCVPVVDSDLSGEVLIRVCFFGDAHISNVKELKEWSNAWHEIGRGIAMAHDLTPEDIKVIGASKGSVIIELLAISAIATTVSTIILSALKVAEKVLDIRKKAAEIRQIDLKNKLLEQNAADLESTAKKEKEDGVKIIINLQIKELNLNKSSEGDKVTALERAITNLVDFVEKGGEVDFVIPEETSENGGDTEAKKGRVSEFALLRSDFEKIKQLEHKIRLLEHHNETGREA